MDNALSGDSSALLREYSRMQLWEIWQAGKRGETLSAEDARMYEVMEHHLQYAWLWDRLDTAGDDEVVQDDVNLVLHIRFHHIVENQLAEDNPPAVGQVMRVLMQKGLKEHDAAHAVASAVAFELYEMMEKSRPFDEQRYIRELRKLPLRLDANREKKKKR